MMRQFAKDMMIYFPARIMPGIIGFISIPIFTRIFAVGEYGNYSLVLTTISVLALLVGWVSTSTSRFYFKFESDGRGDVFLGNVFLFAFLTILPVAAVAYLLVFSFPNAFDQEFRDLFRIGIIIFMLESFFNVVLRIFVMRKESLVYSVFTIINTLGSFLITLIFIFSFEIGIASLLLAKAISLAVLVPLVVKEIISRTKKISFSFDVSLAKDMAAYGFPLVVGNLAAWVLSLSDRYILQLYRGAQEVGIYSASYNIADRSVMLLNSLYVLAAAPLVMHTWENGGVEKSRDVVAKLMRYFLLIFAPIIFGVSFLSRPVALVLLAHGYLDGYLIIPPVMFGVLLLGIQMRFHAGLLFYKQTKYLTYSTIMAGVTNLILNFLFVPRYGFVAAGYTTLLSYAFLLFLIVIFSRKFFIWDFPFTTLKNMVLAALLMGGIVHLIAGGIGGRVNGLVTLGILAILGSLIYVYVLFLLGEFTGEEKAFPEQLLKGYRERRCRKSS